MQNLLCKLQESCLPGKFPLAPGDNPSPGNPPCSGLASTRSGSQNQMKSAFNYVLEFKRNLLLFINFGGS
jgi:hypothetical protein